MISSDTDVYIAEVYNLVKWILSKLSKLMINIDSDSVFTYIIVIVRKLFDTLRLNLPCLNQRLSLFVLSYPILSHPILSYPIPSYPILSHPKLSAQDLESRSSALLPSCEKYISNGSRPCSVIALKR